MRSPSINRPMHGVEVWHSPCVKPEQESVRSRMKYLGRKAAMHLHHILIPLGFSPDAGWVLDYAIEFVQRFQARLTLLHVVHLPPIADVNLASYIGEVEAGAQQEMETYPKRVQEAGISATIRIVHGAPFQEIIDITKDIQADLIIMGTHDRTGVPHLLLGSVAERVVRMAPCPVLVTRRPEAGA
jgi:nucleotide-binding universal stress UspA family protein